MENELYFAKCSDTYRKEIDKINKEIFEERKTTNLSYLEEKNTKLVIHNNNVIGFASIKTVGMLAKLQYGILKEYRNKGYGTALLNKLIKNTYDHGCSRIELMIAPQNKASQNLAHKCGFYVDYDNYNEDAMYITYYKNNYSLMR